MYTLKRFRFLIAKIYNILQYVFDHKLRHMCNLHIKETEISQKRSKGIKNWKITYSVILSVILSVLSNKTNLILGYSSPLNVVCCVHSRDTNRNIKRLVYCRYGWIVKPNVSSVGPSSVSLWPKVLAVHQPFYISICIYTCLVNLTSNSSKLWPSYYRI